VVEVLSAAVMVVVVVVVEVVVVVVVVVVYPVVCNHKFLYCLQVYLLL
jgi:hypothetical protein